MGKDERTRGRAHNTHTKKEEGLPTEGEEGKTQPAPGGGWQPLPPATPTSGSPAPQMAALLSSFPMAAVPPPPLCFGGPSTRPFHIPRSTRPSGRRRQAGSTPQSLPAPPAQPIIFVHKGIRRRKETRELQPLMRRVKSTMTALLAPPPPPPFLSHSNIPPSQQTHACMQT